MALPKSLEGGNGRGEVGGERGKEGQGQGLDFSLRAVGSRAGPSALQFGGGVEGYE